MPFKVNKSIQVPKLSSVSDVELFQLLSAAATDPISASDAFKEFYQRYGDYLWTCCKSICRSIAEGQHLAKDLFQDTLHKIYVKAGTFDNSKGTSTKAWISRIAYNEFIDHYNKYNKHFEITNDLPEIEDVEYDEELISQKLFSSSEVHLRQMLSQLNQKEFKILMTCMSYFQIDNPNAHLPDQVIASLCSEFKIRPDAIRQIKRRALIKLKKMLTP